MRWGLASVVAAICLMGAAPVMAEGLNEAGEDDAVALVVAAAGDIMLGTDYPEPRLPGDAVMLLRDPAPFIRAADIGFGNLEGVLLDGGEPVKRCSDPSACYLFRSPTRYAAVLADAGFTVMSLANNHARDFGEEGRDSSMQALAAHGVRHTGREGDVASWTVRDRTVAVIAFAPFKGANDLLDLPLAIETIRGLSDSHDVVIVSMHAGGEAGDVSRVPFAPEEYRGENRGDVARFARSAIDAGADLVIGHGPHVPRGMEVYRDRLIAYSLGNFATYYGIRVTGDNGLAPLLVARLGPDGRFLGGKIHAFRQRRPAGPVADPAGEVIRKMETLSAMDFGSTAPIFMPDGSILPPRGDPAQSSVAD